MIDMERESTKEDNKLKKITEMEMGREKESQTKKKNKNSRCPIISK